MVIGMSILMRVTVFFPYVQKCFVLAIIVVSSWDQLKFFSF